MRRCRARSGSIRRARWPTAPTASGSRLPAGRWSSRRPATTGCAPRASASSAGRAALTPGGRSMSFNRVAVAILLAAACIGGALACGPNFPWQLLSFRDRTVSDRVELNFGLEAALRYFEAIDQLPPDQRQVRVVAAAFMRGRVYQQLGQLDPARAAFQAARRYAEAGAPDPMGLGVASLGEEARLDLMEAGFIDTPWPVPANDVDDAT